jgi:hypothetical protein
MADVMLAALAGYASLTAAGFDVAPASFQRALEGMLGPREPGPGPGRGAGPGDGRPGADECPRPRSS